MPAQLKLCGNPKNSAIPHHAFKISEQHTEESD